MLHIFRERLVFQQNKMANHELYDKSCLHKELADTTKYQTASKLFYFKRNVSMGHK